MSAQDYSFWSRALHRLALGNRLIAEMSFDVERMLNPTERSGVKSLQHVFVAGLARAGTTVLMRELHNTGAYRSLTYRDMPFLLAPNTWGRVSRQSRIEKEASERAHGDGILVDFDSPEALEEVFWRVHCGSDYIHSDRLVPMQIDAGFEPDFVDYVALVLRASAGKRYLSKNNNNILRLESLQKIFPEATIIIPFREPAAHASSLLQQHKQFLERHAKDSFSRDYMTWLVHHEFGMDHRPFIFSEEQHAELAKYDPAEDIGYWLQLWINCYRYTLSSAPSNCLFVSYERLCDQTEEVWPNMCETLNLPFNGNLPSLQRSQRTANEYDSAEFSEAEDVYAELCARAVL